MTLDQTLKAAESKIQRILLALEEEIFDSGLHVEYVWVDTRNFANMSVEVFAVRRDGSRVSGSGETI